MPDCKLGQGLPAFTSSQSSAGGWFDLLAISAAGHEAIFQFAIGVEFPRQQPSDHEQKYDDS
jgi:hypothetical protein